jgi:hypothetical protein
MLSSGMITPPFLFFLETSLTLWHLPVHINERANASFAEGQEVALANVKDISKKEMNATRV